MKFPIDAFGRMKAYEHTNEDVSSIEDYVNWAEQRLLKDRMSVKAYRAILSTLYDHDDFVDITREVEGQY